jgi:hypothetical protein
MEEILRGGAFSAVMGNSDEVALPERSAIPRNELISGKLWI